MTASSTIRRERSGFLLCTLAAIGLGSMPVLAKLAYAAGADVLTLLSTRFAIGAALLWALAAWRGVARVGDARAALAALALGLLLYAAESGLYATALTRIDASLGELLMFAYPAIVVVAAIALRREPPAARPLVATAISTGGIALVLAGGATGALDPLGVALALCAATLYAGYVLSAGALGGRLHPLAFAALVCTGTAVSFTLAGAASGSLRPAALGPEAWLWTAALGVLSTAVAMSALIAGIERIGPSRAAITSALDPLVAMAAGAAVFSERLTPPQLLGALLVVAAVVVLRLPARVRRRTARRAAAAARRPACAPPAAPVPSRDRGASPVPTPEPPAGALARLAAQRR